MSGKQGRPLVVSYGGGLNSTAVLVGLRERDVVPDAILFADTGGENPHTYTFIHGELRRWLERASFPELTIVVNDGMYASLEDNCLKKRMLPSLAYGFKSCSDKYKRRPQEKWAKAWQPAIDTWARGERVIKAIGFDADEPHRASKSDGDEHYEHWFPLIEWDWGRDECAEQVKKAGLPLPGKSACFFCPASKKAEILALARCYPDLAERAVAMEKNAELGSVEGLGRRFSWGKFLEADRRQQRLFPEGDDLPCMCHD